MEDAKMPTLMIMGGIPEPFLTASENRKNTETAIRDWMLGPEKPTNERGANKPYWVALGKAWGMPESSARRRRCSNCEYYDNSVEKQVQMDAVPWNQWDVGAGFRGHCTKLNFICHDLRSCQAWEEREYEEEEEEDDSED